MASVVGDLAVRVGADIADFEGGMAKASRSVKNFSKQSIKELRAVADQTVKSAAIAATASAAIIASMSKAGAETAKELTNFSRVANTTAEDFQKIAFGAEKFGVEADKVADILKDVNDRVGDFVNTGGGPMADFFEKIAPRVGVTVSQFQKLSGPDALQLYISSLEKANLSQAEMTFFLEAMSSDLTNLLPLFAKNGEALKETSKRAEELGLVVSDLDIARLNDMSQTFDEIGAQASAASTIIAAKMSPFIKELTINFQDLIGSSGDFGENVEEAMRKAIHFAGQFADVIHGLKVTFKGVEVLVSALGGAIIGVAQLGVEAFGKMADFIIADVNKTITALNQIPKIDIATIDPFTDSAFVQGIRLMGSVAEDTTRKLQAEFQAMAMAPRPSDQVVEFLERVKVASEEMPESIMPSITLNQEEIDDNERRLREHLADMSGILNTGYTAQDAMNRTHWGAIGKETAGAMKSVVGTMATGSKKAFEISKAWAVADALISTFQGIAAGVKMGWPQGIPAVAWAAATGYAQVSAIKNQQFGGAGGAAASGGGAPATAPNPVGVGGSTGGQQAASGGTLTIAPVDPTAIFSGEVVQGTIDRISEFTKDGGRVVTLEQ